MIGQDLEITNTPDGHVVSILLSFYFSDTCKKPRFIQINEVSRTHSSKYLENMFLCKMYMTPLYHDPQNQIE